MVAPSDHFAGKVFDLSQGGLLLDSGLSLKRRLREARIESGNEISHWESTDDSYLVRFGDLSRTVESLKVWCFLRAIRPSLAHS